MDKRISNTSILEEKKEDSKEIIEILKNIPENKKERIIGIMEGIILGADKGGEEVEQSRSGTL